MPINVFIYLQRLFSSTGRRKPCRLQHEQLQQGRLLWNCNTARTWYTGVECGIITHDCCVVKFVMLYRNCFILLFILLFCVRVLVSFHLKHYS